MFAQSLYPSRTVPCVAGQPPFTSVVWLMSRGKTEPSMATLWFQSIAPDGGTETTIGAATAATRPKDTLLEGSTPSTPLDSLRLGLLRLLRFCSDETAGWRVDG